MAPNGAIEKPEPVNRDWLAQKGRECVPPRGQKMLTSQSPPCPCHAIVRRDLRWRSNWHWRFQNASPTVRCGRSPTRGADLHCPMGVTNTGVVHSVLESHGWQIRYFANLCEPQKKITVFRRPEICAISRNLTQCGSPNHDGWMTNPRTCSPQVLAVNLVMFKRDFMHAKGSASVVY